MNVEWITKWYELDQKYKRLLDISYEEWDVKQ